MLLSEGVAAAGGGYDRVDKFGVFLQQLLRGAEDELGVGGSAELVDLEDADRDALLAQGHALGVPEAGGGGDLAGGEGGDGGEADRHLVDCGRIAAVGFD